MTGDSTRAAEIIRATHEGPRTVFSGVSIDSRTISAGDLFFALKGPSFDGHDFVSQALSRGAGAVVAMSFVPPPDLSPEKVLLRVEDPSSALRSLASQTRDEINPTVVGITGSVGKTTTKEMVAAVLARRYAVHRTEGNLNNTIGLPLVLSRMPEGTQVAVLEMGMSFPGEISTLSRLARPDIGIVTAVAPVHLMNFDSIEGIREAKAEILDGMGPASTFVANADDPRVRDIARRHSGRVVTYSATDVRATDVRATDVWLSNLEERFEGPRFALTAFGETVSIELPLPGLHNARNFLAAAAVGVVLGVPVSELAEAAALLRPAPHRSQVIELRSGILLYDDCYNSSPAAVRAGYRAFEAISSGRRRIAVLGEMLELGPSSQSFHREVGRDLARRFDLLIAVRGEAAGFIEGAREAGGEEPDAIFAENADEAAEVLLRAVRRGDAVFVKGSRGVKLDRAVDRLTGGAG